MLRRQPRGVPILLFAPMGAGPAAAAGLGGADRPVRGQGRMQPPGMDKSTGPVDGPVRARQAGAERRSEIAPCRRGCYLGRHGFLSPRCLAHLPAARLVRRRAAPGGVGGGGEERWGAGGRAAAPVGFGGDSPKDRPAARVLRRWGLRGSALSPGGAGQPRRCAWDTAGRGACWLPCDDGVSGHRNLTCLRHAPPGGPPLQARCRRGPRRLDRT
mmetsp:Transcript_90385/g.206713  ORF Transcript_90385/g.206713 Transcript_90385/m.206713 type:complete len:214 (-) Transcript_90385:431-1072(-)